MFLIRRWLECGLRVVSGRVCAASDWRRPPNVQHPAAPTWFAQWSSQAGSALFGGIVLLHFGDVSGQRGFVGQTHQVVADQFGRVQRRLAAGPEAHQQTGDDRVVRLNLDAVVAVAE